MQGGVWSGLGRSPFVADAAPIPKPLRRLAVTLGVGIALALLAAAAMTALLLVPGVFAFGDPRDGLGSLAAVAQLLAGATSGPQGFDAYRLVFNVLVNGVGLLAFVASAAALRGQAVIRLVTAARKVRWRLFLTGAVLAAILLAPEAILDRLSNPGPSLVHGAGMESFIFAGVYLFATLWLIPASWIEELLFRGWLLRSIATLTRRPAVLIFAPALIFAGFHTYDLTVAGLLARTMMGAAFAYMTLRLGGIELAAGAHAANNLLIVWFVESIQDAARPTTGGFGATELLLQVAVCLGYVGIAEAVARIGFLRRMAGVEARDLSPSARSPAGV